MYLGEHVNMSGYATRSQAQDGERVYKRILWGSYDVFPTIVRRDALSVLHRALCQTNNARPTANIS